MGPLRPDDRRRAARMMSRADPADGPGKSAPEDGLIGRRPKQSWQDGARMVYFVL